MMNITLLLDFILLLLSIKSHHMKNSNTSGPPKSFVVGEKGQASSLLKKGWNAGCRMSQSCFELFSYFHFNSLLNGSRLLFLSQGTEEAKSEEEERRAADGESSSHKSENRCKKLKSRTAMLLCESGKEHPDNNNFSFALPASGLTKSNDRIFQEMHTFQFNRPNTNITMIDPNSPDNVTHTPIHLIRKEVELPTRAPPKIHVGRWKCRMNSLDGRNGTNDKEHDYRCISSCKSMPDNLLMPNLDTDVSSEFRGDMDTCRNYRRVRSLSLPPSLAKSSKERDTFFSPIPSSEDRLSKALTTLRISQLSYDDENRCWPSVKKLPIKICPRVSDVDSSVVDEMFELKKICYF